MESSYPVLLFVGVLIGFVITNLVIIHIVGPRKRTAVKQMPYESGMDPVGDARQPFDVKFYLVAILFLVFDVELVLVLPVLVRFTHFIQIGHGALVFAKVFLFVGTLLLGLVYAGVRGDLSWDKSISSKESSCD